MIRLPPQPLHPHGSRSDPSLPPTSSPPTNGCSNTSTPVPKEGGQRKDRRRNGLLHRADIRLVRRRPRRMGWNALLREEFGRKRVDLIDAATRFYLHPNRKYPLSPTSTASSCRWRRSRRTCMPRSSFPARSRTSSRLRSKTSPRNARRSRLQRLRKAQAKRDVAKLGVYPSRRRQAHPLPVSDPGASTSYSGRKRSRSEASSDDDEDSLSKRFRTDGAFALPSPPLFQLLLPPPVVSAAYPTQMLLPALNACAPTALPPTPFPSPFPSRERPTSWPDWFSSDQRATRISSSPTSSWTSSSSTRPSTTCPKRRLPRRLSLLSKQQRRCHRRS
ncbi:hypothetical protein B0H14DRAFT_2870540 [Mycena olivaceomarginata]|nr:hypothetical protein B0H14DRAFT_2870540 [Mycena olivaceomarginata]